MSECRSDDDTGGGTGGDARERRSGCDRRLGHDRREGGNRRSGTDRRGSGLKTPQPPGAEARPYGFRSFEDRREGEDRRSGADRRGPFERRYTEPQVTLSAEELEALLGAQDE